MYHVICKITEVKIRLIALLSTALVLIICRTCLADDKTAHQLLAGAIERFDSVQSYTCLLDKRVVKAGKLYEDLSISVKYKKPTRYYFRWQTGARKGREAIFIAGKHNNKIVAHPGGRLFRFMTLHLNPEGRLAMKENRHSLQNSGLEKIIQLVEADFKRAQQNGLDAIRYTGEEHLDDRMVWVVEGRFPKNQGYYARTVILYIDQTLGLPIKVSIYDESDALAEEYVFHQLAINVNLTDQDFDPDNPDYDFY
jgi:outer membrane lipoprotein-sorting protein